jgi:hypothetical protein
MARSGKILDQCPRGGTVHINGKDYCGQHAGQVALALLLNEPIDFNQSWDDWKRNP